MPTTATLTGTGKIKQRVIDTFGETNAVANAYYLHTYNNENFKSLGSEKHDITDVVTVEAADAKTTLTGLIATDATGDGAVQFQSSGTVYYYDASNRLTENATGSGITVGGSDSSASYAIVEAEIKNPSSSKAKNYTVAAQKGMKYNSTTVSVISKRTISADVTTKDIGKEYDGSADVLSPYGAGSTNLAYTGASATTAENYQDHRLVSDGTTIGITSAKYQITNGEANAADVAFDTSGAEMAKNIAYTIAITGDKAANYNLNGKNSATDNTITGSGTITRAPLVLEFSDAKKRYNATTVVALDTTTEAADTTLVPTVTAYWLKKTGTDGARTKTAQTIDNQTTFKAMIEGNYEDANWGSNKTITYKAKESVDANGDMQAVVNAGISKNFKLVNITDTTQPITDTNFTVTSTVYGKGEITRRSITKDDLLLWTKPSNNTSNEVTAKYAGTSTTGTKTYTNTSSATTVTATNYVNKTLMEQILTDADKEQIKNNITIAEAIYNANPDEAGRTVGDVGTYTDNVTLSFNFASTNLGNYEIAEDAATFSQSGYKGVITPKQVVATLKNNAPKPKKTYDGTATVKADGVVVTSADIETDGGGQTTLKSWDKWFNLTGMVGNETLNLNGVTATYENPNVQTNAAGSNMDQNKVVYENFTNALADGTGKAYNYAMEVHDSNNATVNSIKGVGTINKRHVTVTGISSVDKDYDGNANVLANKVATVTMAGASGNTGIVAADATAKGSIAITMGSPTSADAKTGTYAHAYVNRDNADDPAGSWTVTYNKNVYDYLTNQLGGNYALDADNIYIKANDTSHVYGTGIINPKEYNITNVDIQSTISKEYDGTDKIGKATGTSTANAITKAQLGITDDSLWDKLEVTGTYGESTEGAGDAANAKSSKPISVLIVLQADSSGHYNYYMKDGDVKKSQKTLTSETLGKIEPKKLYAYLDKDSRVSLTKVYDGTTDVKATKNNGQTTVAIEDIKAWVKLDNDSLAAITAIGDGSGIHIKNSGINVAYEDKNVNNTSGEDFARKVEFTNISLVNSNDTVNSNYELILDKNTPTATKLTTAGKITKRPVQVTGFGNTVVENPFNRSALVKASLDAVQPTLEQSIASVPDRGVVTADATTVYIDKAKLKGIYGTWDTDSKTFEANSHVKYTGNVIAPQNVAKQDVLYYNLELAGGAAGNYELDNSRGATVTGLSAADKALTDADNLSTTAYFKEAVQRGKITPLAITMDNVSANGKPIYKVYDGSESVEGFAYDPDSKTVGTTKTTLQEYFKVFYDANHTDGDEFHEGVDVVLPYTVTSAIFTGNDGANAGQGKTVKFTGFSLTADTETMGDYGINEATKQAIEDYYNDPTHRTTTYARAGNLPTTGSIARRLLVVEATSDPTNANYRDHSKTYDGNEHTYYKDAAGNLVMVDADHQLPYMVAAQANQNDVMGLVGDDQVSVTYVANFVKKNNDNSYSLDPDVNRKADGSVDFKDVKYEFTLSGAGAANYTIDSTKRGFTSPGVVDGGMTTTKYQENGSRIEPKKVIVKFKAGVDMDKLYDGDAQAFKDKNMETEVLEVSGLGEITDGVTFNYAGITGNDAFYVSSGNEDAKDVVLKNDGSVDTKTVYVQNLNLAGAKKGNYVVMAGDENGNEVDGKQTLVGKGKITPRRLDVTIQTDSNGDPIVPTKVYDGDTSVKELDGETSYAPTEAGTVGRQLTASDPYIKIAGTESGVIGGKADGFAAGEGINDVKISVTQALYHDKNANDGIGITYTLKWDNKNYKLVHYALDGTEKVRTTLEGTGNIKKRTLVQQNPPTIEKTYDGTAALGDTSAVATGLFNNVVKGDEATILTIDRGDSHYDRANVYAATDTAAAIAAAGTKGTDQGVTVKYSLNDSVTGSGKNYQLDEGNTYREGTFNGTGRINRAQVMLKPTEVSYYADELSGATYTGTYSGFVNGEDFPNGYTLTFDRDRDKSTTAGKKYTLLGYVNGQGASTDATKPLFVTGMENYYFSTTENSALYVVERSTPTPAPTPTPTPTPKPIGPVNPEFPIIIPGNGNKTVTQAVSETVISDTKFTPDDYSYNRMSKDQDVTRVNRESSASLQYSEKGVNLDDESRSGLAALADIQGNGSVVNLEGALIQTSAPVEQPEKIAEAAALPIPEPEENDISSIDLEYADNTSGQQAVLEILTNASSKAENKGTSIVIDTQDEDEENAEEEKTRRAIFADRSNIGIETLGDAVNLKRMIG